MDVDDRDADRERRLNGPIPMAKKSKIEPRKMMEKAIEVMRQSINEPRADGKASPLVGAVLVKPDGSVETAYRGELREGDHAEFTLLERKNRANRLDGSVLYATLEPCAQGARSHPKLGCAERIVNARIKEVWVGIEDPDPTVDRKGIKFLQDHGVTVHMFDRDLQEQIHEANKDFINQALERKEAAEGPKKAVVLSQLEAPASRAVIGDLSHDALQIFRDTAKISAAVGSEPFQRRLLQMGLLRESGQKLVPTGFGLLLFGNHPRTAMQQAGLLGTIHLPSGKEDLKDFDGPQALVPLQVLAWLRDKLPNPISRSEGRRREDNEAFFELVREGVVNALVHRDYGIEGAKCQLVVTPHTVVVKSPGRPVEPITLEQMQKFEAPMLSRNPVLHYVFSEMELAEERGLGLKSMKERARTGGLPQPTYTFDGVYLSLTIHRDAQAAVQALDAGVLGALNKSEQAGWKLVSIRGKISSSEYAREMEFDDRTARRHLNKFLELGLVRKFGSGPATIYEIK